MNKNIGELGRSFIAQRTEIGIAFDDAWAEWEVLSSRLHFVLIDCPDVRYYDDRRVMGRDERLHVREMAQDRLGRHIRSSDVSVLAKAAEGLNVCKQVRPYHMDREVIRDLIAFVADAMEAEEGYTDDVAMLRAAALNDEDEIESWAKKVERFVETHSLWDVSPRYVLRLYMEADASGG